jgi:two-component system cell cycle sensor histidine kinase PleC
MVRAFAANSGLLRDGVTDARPEPASLRSRREILLDRSVIFLVLAFLTISALSITTQFTTSRSEQLEASEKALAVATRMIASEMSMRVMRGHAPAPADLEILAASAMEKGRRFLFIDNAGAIRAASDRDAVPGTAAARLFADPDALSSLDRRGRIAHRRLADGRSASVARIMDEAIGGGILALQPIEDELAPWRKHALTMSAILLAFGAVTIAFALAFHAQRQRAVHAGTSARQLRSQFEIALDYGRCGLWDWSLRSDRILWSDSMVRMVGFAADGVLDRQAIEERLHPDDRDLFDALRWGSGSNAELDRLFRMRHDERGWLWLRMRAILVDRESKDGPRLIGMVMDVTREREAEAEIRRADSRLRDAIESISEAFVLWDENNRLVLCNSKYQGFHGLSSECVRRGAPYSRVMTAAREPRVLIEIDCGSQPETGTRCYEAQFQDGSWLLISERRTRDGGYVSVGTDITARKLQEQRLLDNERQLRMTITDLGQSREAFRRQAGQLAELADRYLEQRVEAVSANRAKAEFLTNMNHEIRTPLNHIIGFAEMIEAEMFGPAGSPRYLEYARDIRLSGTNLLALISDILDMARIEAGRVALDRSETPLGALLARAAGDVHCSAEAKGITIELEPDIAERAGQRLIHVDVNALGQALAHLMRNAIRLSRAGGRLSVRARMAGDFVNIFIADHACNLTAGELGKLVDPFGHIDGMLQDGCKGSGLGVPIARALIELHGGTIRLRAAPEIGSLVLVRLPVAAQPLQIGLARKPARGEWLGLHFADRALEDRADSPLA